MPFVIRRKFIVFFKNLIFFGFIAIVRVARRRSEASRIDSIIRRRCSFHQRSFPKRDRSQEFDDRTHLEGVNRSSIFFLVRQS